MKFDTAYDDFDYDGNYEMFARVATVAAELQRLPTAAPKYP